MLAEGMGRQLADTLAAYSNGTRMDCAREVAARWSGDRRAVAAYIVRSLRGSLAAFRT